VALAVSLVESNSGSAGASTTARLKIENDADDRVEIVENSDPPIPGNTRYTKRAEIALGAMLLI
jgi:hypothetical protein